MTYMSHIIRYKIIFDVIPVFRCIYEFTNKSSEDHPDCVELEKCWNQYTWRRWKLDDNVSFYFSRRNTPTLTCMCQDVFVPLSTTYVRNFRYFRIKILNLSTSCSMSMVYEERRVWTCFSFFVGVKDQNKRIFTLTLPSHLSSG